MALYRENATGFVQEWASNPGAGYTAITVQPTDTLANRVAWWRDVDKGSQTSSWHPSEYRTPQDPAEAVLSMAFSQEAAFFSADGDGVVTDNYLGGSCTVSVFRGSTDVTDSEDWVLTKVDEGCTSTLEKAGGVWTLTITDVPLQATQSGYVRVTATREGSTTQVRDWRWIKVPSGSNGTSGENAKALSLIISAQAYVMKKDGTISPESATATAVGQNLAGLPKWYWKWVTAPDVDGGDGTTGWVLWFEDDLSFTWTILDEPSWDIKVVWDGLTDKVSMARLEEGSDAIQVVLSNEAHVLPADSEGNVISYAGSGTEIRVYEGATLLDWEEPTVSAGTWGWYATWSNILYGDYSAGGSAPYRYAILDDASSFDPNEDSATITFTIIGITKAGVPFSIPKVQSFSKAKTGVTGTRGSRQILVTTADGIWSDLTAWNGIVTQTGTTPVLSDLVTIAKSDGSDATSKFCTDNSEFPGAWTEPTQYINGSLLVTGTVGADKMVTGTITADSGIINDLSASVLTSGTISSSTITLNGATSILKSSTYVAGSAGWQIKGDGSLEANSGTFRNVTVTGTLTASSTYSGTWTAANIPNLSAGKITTGTLDCSLLTVTNLSASSINTGTLSASRISGGTLNAGSITVTNLSANSITVGTLTTGQIANEAVTSWGGYTQAGFTSLPSGYSSAITFWTPGVAAASSGQRGVIVFHVFLEFTVYSATDTSAYITATRNIAGWSRTTELTLPLSSGVFQSIGITWIDDTLNTNALSYVFKVGVGTSGISARVSEILIQYKR